MSTITVSKTFKVTIKGQEFELTADEARALHVALDAALDKPTVVVSPKRNAPLDEAIPATPWRQPFSPPPYRPPVDHIPRHRRPQPGEIWACDRHAVAVLGSDQRLLMHISSTQ